MKDRMLLLLSAIVLTMFVPETRSAPQAPSQAQSQAVNLHITIGDGAPQGVAVKPTGGSSVTSDNTACTWIRSDTCYIAVKERYTWDNAEQNCQQLGGHLAVPDDYFENKYLKEKIEETFFKADIPCEGEYWECHKAVWVGIRLVGDVWSKVAGGAAIFTDWNEDEPNDGAGDICVESGEPWNGKWNDLGCADWRRFSICELRR